MQALIDQIRAWWTALGAPAALGLDERLTAILVLLMLCFAIGLWIGQYALTSNMAFYPRERFALALSWSAIAGGTILTIAVVTAWLAHRQTTWAALLPFLVSIAVLLIVTIVILPSKPRA